MVLLDLVIICREKNAGMFCSKCKTDDMINVNNKRCVCGRSQPHFNFEGESALYCSQCKLDGMVEVKHKKCECGTTEPIYNFPDIKPPICCNLC